MYSTTCTMCCLSAGVTTRCRNDDLHNDDSRVLPKGAHWGCAPGGFTDALQHCEAACHHDDSLAEVDSLAVECLADNSWGTAQGSLHCNGAYVSLIVTDAAVLLWTVERVMQTAGAMARQ